MKRPLILGLGNALMGDDGVGVRVAEILAADAWVTARAEVIAAGTDLLRFMDRFEGRKQIILIDAVAGEEPGRISLVGEALLEERQEYAHSLSAPQAVALLQSVMPVLRETKFTWLLIHVGSVCAGEQLSTEVASAVHLAAAVVRGLL